MNMTVDDFECAQNLSHEVCGVIIKLWNKDPRSVSVHVRHASVEVQVHCVNVVIGVVLGELHVVRVVPVVVCDDAVVRRTLVLIAFMVAIVFIIAILRRMLLYWRYSVYKDKTTLPEKMRTTLSGSGCWCTHCQVPRKHRCCH